MINPIPLSPAAQAVLDAYWDDAPLEAGAKCGLAAALRAAADQVGQVPAHPVNTEWDKGFVDGARLVYRELLGIAAELEAQ